MHIEEIHWVDAMLESDDFKPDDDHEFCKRVTIGWFVKETKEGIVLATDYYTSEKHAGHYNARMTIPWGMITARYAWNDK